MRSSSMNHLVLLAVGFFFGMLVWFDDTPAYTQTEPTTIQQLTDHHTIGTGSCPSGFTELNGSVYFGLHSKKGGFWKTNGAGQDTVLLKDIAVAPQTLQRIGDRLLFAGREQSLWISDGSVEGTVPLTDTLYAYPYEFALMGETIYFLASAGFYNIGLWKSDGTPQGTTLVTNVSGTWGDFWFISPHITVGDGLLYFDAYDEEQGAMVLWESDGTSAGTRKVPNSPQSPSQLTLIEGALYFLGSTAAEGTELWKYGAGDTEATLVMDIGPGSASGISEYGSLDVLNSQLLFVADDGIHGPEIWRSDGSVVGTQMVTALTPDSGELVIEAWKPTDEALYFTLYAPGAGDALWKTDGTTTGSQLLYELADGVHLNALTQVGNLFYFLQTASPGSQQSLWRSDGSPEGTFQLLDIGSYSTGEYDGKYAVANGLLFIVASDADGNQALWKSDGSVEGTMSVQDLGWYADHPHVNELIETSTKLYYTVQTSDSAYGWWSSDGTPDGAQALSGPMTQTDCRLAAIEVNKKLYFNGYDEIHGNELWVSDGTEAGTTFIKELDPNNQGQRFDQLARVNSRLYFTTRLPHEDFSDTGITSQLWVRQGAAEEAILLDQRAGVYTLAPAGENLFVFGEIDTKLGLWQHDGAGNTLKLIYQFSEGWLRDYITLDEQLLMVVRSLESLPASTLGYELWRIDGASEGLAKLAEGLDAPSALVMFNNQVLLGNRNELWVTDGTPNGTTHFTPTGLQSSIVRFTSTSNSLYFVTDYDAAGAGNAEVWRTDGTLQGTSPLLPDEELGYVSLFSVGDTLYIASSKRDDGNDLWRIDGASSNAQLLTADAELHNISLLATIDDAIFLSANGPDFQKALWYYDGGSSPLVHLHDFATHFSGTFYGQTTANGQLYFVADDGIYGRELWKSDGTPEGTALVKDIRTDAAEAYPGPPFRFGDQIYFDADDGVHGRELWKSDGTAEGTVMLRDIFPGVNSAKPVDMTGGNTRFFFSAYENVNGRELWQSDGTSAGTSLVGDLYPGGASADPLLRFFSDQTLFFSADNGIDGQQLFGLNDLAAPLALPESEEPLPPLPYRLYVPVVSR